MAVISKKTALVWVLIVAGAVTLWKFVWKPMETKEVAAPSVNPSSQSVPSNTVMTPGENPATTSARVQKSAAIRTSYSNPAGNDEVGFVLFVDENGLITEAVTEVLAIHEISKARQAAFGAGLGEVLKGKKLSELSAIDKVGGSSLTTNAFNKVLPELKSQL